MKRTLVASILGLAASVATSYGQATYFFDTYAPKFQPYGPSGLVLLPGGAVGGTADGIVANLLWQVGASSGIANAVPVQLDQYGFISNNFSPNAGPGNTQVSFLPSYIAFTDVTFTIQAWKTGAGITGYNNALVRGELTWVDPGIPTGAGFQNFDGAAFPGGSLQLTVVPEPSTFALAGLGAAAMLIFRKRQ